MDNNRIGFVNLNDQYRLNSSKSKRNQNGVLDQRVGKLASAKYRSNSHGSCDKDQSFKKSKMFNIGSRSNKNKNQKGGIAMGSSVINHNPLV